MNCRSDMKQAQRSGMTLIVVLVCLAIVMALVVTWAKTALVERRQLRSLEDQAQAVWLANSGIERAAWQLAQNGDYVGETWEVTPADLSGERGGLVKIRIDKPAEATEAGATQSCAIVVTADFPTGSERRALHTKKLNISLSKTGDNP